MTIHREQEWLKVTVLFTSSYWAPIGSMVTPEGGVHATHTLKSLQLHVTTTHIAYYRVDDQNTGKSRYERTASRKASPAHKYLPVATFLLSLKLGLHLIEPLHTLHVHAKGIHTTLTHVSDKQSPFAFTTNHVLYILDSLHWQTTIIILCHISVQRPYGSTFYSGDIQAVLTAVLSGPKHHSV